jgi:hypothetical protein
MLLCTHCFMHSAHTVLIYIQNFGGNIVKTGQGPIRVNTIAVVHCPSDLDRLLQAEYLNALKKKRGWKGEGRVVWDVKGNCYCVYLVILKHTENISEGVSKLSCFVYTSMNGVIDPNGLALKRYTQSHTRSHAHTHTHKNTHTRKQTHTHTHTHPRPHNPPHIVFP